MGAICTHSPFAKISMPLQIPDDVYDIAPNHSYAETNEKLIEIIQSPESKKSICTPTTCAPTWFSEMRGCHGFSVGRGELRLSEAMHESLIRRERVRFAGDECCDG
jgi:hypothetical protein